MKLHGIIIFLRYKFGFMVKVYLLLGGNLGNVLENFERTISLISTHIGLVISRSAIYKSEPWGYESENWYHNMVLEVDATFDAIQLLDITQLLERELGRVAKTTNSYTDRPIDIDILDFGGTISHSERLTLPHPRLHLRKFALLPLADVAPDYIHPLFHLTVKQMLNEVNDDSVILKI